MNSANGKWKRFSKEELAALTRPAMAEVAAQRRELLRRATTGLRVNVRLTRDM